ncbi:hypothetical protein [Lichenibacterium dinghuense]|uniref:hypothetical protein n=1 Tax=Lichenibacterium dinghuense TaxID=2895977 RepID=UPI001F43172F|nr:hypothetical protein [Lichenibacterium sp. 6Y81]
MTTATINNGSRARGKSPSRPDDRVVRRVVVSLNVAEAYDLDHYKDRSRRCIGEVYSDAEAMRRAVADWRHESLPCDAGYIDLDEIAGVFRALASADTPEAMTALRDKARRMVAAS